MHDSILDSLPETVTNIMAPDAVPISKFYEVLGVTEGNPIALLASFLSYVSSISTYFYFETTAIEENTDDGEVRYYTSPDSLMFEVMHCDAFFAAGNPHPFVDAFIKAIESDDFSFDFLFLEQSQRELQEMAPHISFKFQAVQNRDYLSLSISATHERAMRVEMPD